MAVLAGAAARAAHQPRPERSEFDQVTIDARRVARVMAGVAASNFSRSWFVIGDRQVARRRRAWQRAQNTAARSR